MFSLEREGVMDSSYTLQMIIRLTKTMANISVIVLIAVVSFCINS